MNENLRYEHIQLPLGELKGCVRTTIYDIEYLNFEGIPYAQPPVGDLRFKSPLPAKPWTGIRDCSEFNVKPMQHIKATGAVEGSEDCLYLNIYAKRLNSEKPLPVMIWLYGGGFAIGEATKTVYSPDYFMAEDIVLVTLNYRLCSLGFLSLKDPSLQVPGNAGLKDQVLALKWVNQYIEYFNGDPENITLFGVSAGAASVHYLASTPLAKGLFHKAICMSGTILNCWADTPQTDQAFRLAKFHGYEGANDDRQVLAFLQSLDSQQLVKHDILTQEEKLNGILFSFAPCVEAYVGDDCVIPKNAREILKTAWGNDIPMLIGGCANEGYLMYTKLKMYPQFMNALGNDLVLLLPLEVRELENNPAQCLAKATRLKELHFAHKTPSSECLEEFLDFYHFKLFWHGFHRTLLSRMSHATSDTYLYHFDFDSPTFNQQRKHFGGGDLKTGVAHGDDVSYLWFNAKAWKLDIDSKEYKTIERMINIFTTFARTSNPNGQETKNLNWLPLTRNEPHLGLSISNELSVGLIPEKEKLVAWDALYDGGYLY